MKTETKQSDIVEYRFIPKKVYNVENPNHILGRGRMPGVTDSISVLRSEMGSYVIALTKTELTKIEKELSLKPGTLNVNNRFNEYLEGIDITMNIDKRTLDLSDPYQRLLDGILRAYSNVIAPDLKSIKNRPTYRYVRVLEGEETDLVNAEFNLNKNFYKELGRIEDNKFKMLMYLSSINERFSASKSTEELIAIVNTKADLNKEQFLSILSDPDFNYKGIVGVGTQMGVISYKGSMYYYKDIKLGDGDNIATFDESVRFLKNKKNKDIYMSIQKEINDGINGAK